MLIEQAEQSARGAAEMSAVQGDLLEERLGAGARGHQPISAAVLACAALVVGEPVEMALVFDLSAALPGALVHGDFVVAVEHADAAVGGDERQGLSEGVGIE